MKALVQTKYGNNNCLEIQDFDIPEPLPNEVLIKVSHAGLNPVDYKIRDGLLRQVRPMKFPHIAGNEASGTIEKVGSNVTRFKTGDRVFTKVNSLNVCAFAEYFCEDSSLVAMLPDNIDFDVAAGVPLVALTSWQCLYELANINTNTKILIHAGAGSVGRIAIQLAKLKGSHVTTTVSDRGVDLVKSLGADEIINYKNKDFRESGRVFDVVYDTVGGETLEHSFEVTNKNGLVISIAGMPEVQTAKDLNRDNLLFRTLFYFSGWKSNRIARKNHCKYRYVFMQANGKQLEKISQLISSGKLSVSFDRSFPLADFESAFDYLESGKSYGKIILSID